ncbi:hypothetical protein ACI65C_013230 [Semiaphis heraclei]
MMSSRAKKAKLNDDLINQILEIDNSSNSSEFSDFDDTDEDVTYNPNSSESDVESDVEDSINDEKIDSSPESSSNSTRIEVWNDVTGKNRKQFLFNNTYSGLKVDIPPDSSVLDIFKLFFTSEIIDLIVVETNRNAEQFLSKNRLTKSSRFAKWIPTNENEIQKFFGKLKITQFREILVDQMLELEKQNESIVNEPSTSGNKRSKGNTKHYFQETTEKCNRNRKLRKRCVHCYQSIKDVEGTAKAREAYTNNKAVKWVSLCCSL